MRVPENTHPDELGHNRVHFKNHAILYLVIIAASWLLWFATGSGYMWPIWPMAIGFIGMAFHYMMAWGE